MESRGAVGAPERVGTSGGGERGKDGEVRRGESEDAEGRSGGERSDVGDGAEDEASKTEEEAPGVDVSASMAAAGRPRKGGEGRVGREIPREGWREEKSWLLRTQGEGEEGGEETPACARGRERAMTRSRVSIKHPRPKIASCAAAGRRVALARQVMLQVPSGTAADLSHSPERDPVARAYKRRRTTWSFADRAEPVSPTRRHRARHWLPLTTWPGKNQRETWRWERNPRS